MDENSYAEEGYLGPVTVNSFEDRFFYNINRATFNKSGAAALFERKFAATLFAEDSLNIVVGTDSGLLPKYVQSQSLPKGSRYIFIEPASVLTALKSRDMLLGLNAERIVCICMEDWLEAISAFKIKDYFYINAVHSFNAFCAEDDFINEYAEISWHITEVLSQLHWANTMELGSEAFITRQLENVADNLRPAKLLEQAFVGKSVLLLAGGPSLDAALPWVREHRQQLVIFAVSRIARQLLNAQINPDFVFSVDPTELSFDVSKEMLRFNPDTVFVHSNHTVSALVTQWPGLSLYLGARFPWKSKFNQPNFSAAGPTVTNTALNTAYYFGFKRIVLIGVDLCFTKDGFTHARGSNEQLAGPRFNLTSLQLETNNGDMAPTSCDFAQAVASLALQAKYLQAHGCSVINVSENAAKVENIQYLPLDALEWELEKPNVQAVLASRLAVSEDEAAFSRKIFEELNRARFQIQNIARLATDARLINDGMYNAQGLIDDYRDKKKLDQIEKKFKREYREFSKLVKKFGIRRFIKLTKPFTDEEWTAEEAKQFGNVYYDAYAEGADKLLKLLDQALARLMARNEERVVNPDFQKLLKQCHQDKSYGRVVLWRRKFADAKLPASILASFQELEERFQVILCEQNTRHFLRTKHQSSLLNLKQRAALLFKHKKPEEMQALLHGLDKHQQADEAKCYRHLIEGYLAELYNQPEIALQAYQAIVDAADILLEEALSRIAGIGIERQDMDTAKLSLQCLSQINPLFLPLYAEILALQGEFMPAVDVFHAYVMQFPDDSLTQIKLINLYIEHRVYDAAELMVNYILQNKPDYLAALQLQSQILSLKNGNIPTVS